MLRGGIFLALVLMPITVLAGTRDKLDGWGPFKFSMSMNDAITASAGNASLGRGGSLAYPTEIGGISYVAHIWFAGVGQRIRQISIEPSAKDRLSREACLDTGHASFVAPVIERYGQPNETHEKTYYAGQPMQEFSRFSIFKFDDGARIEVMSTYKVRYEECDRAVTYLPPAGTPKGEF